MKRAGLMLCLLLLFCPVLHAAETLRMGVLPVIDILPLAVAEEEGLFKAQGLDVELINFNSALERDAAYSSGGIDAYFGDLVITTLLKSKGYDVAVLTESYHTAPEHAMFALLASPKSRITDAATLGKAKVAISNGSVIEYFLDRMSARTGLKAGEVQKMELRAIPIRYQMLMEGAIDAALLPDPLLSTAVAGGARVILDDRNLDTTCTVLVARRAFLKDHPGMDRRFLAAYGEAVSRINAHPERYMETLSRRTRFPESLQKTYVMPPFPAPALPREMDISAVETWLHGKGYISELIPYEDMVWRVSSQP